MKKKLNIKIHQIKFLLNKFNVETLEDINWYSDKDKWTGLRSIGMIRKTIEKDGESKTETRYYISSLPVNVIDFSNAIRMHWSVENKLH